MRAIFIDPENKKIQEVSINSVDNVKNILGTKNPEYIGIDSQIALAYSDKPQSKNAFSMLGLDDIIHSKALVIGVSNGRLKTMKENLKSFEMLIEWKN